MTNNTQQLPADFQTQLDNLVMKHTLELRNDNDYQIGYEKGVEKGIEIGATEYATKLHEAQQEIKSLKGSIETHKRSYDARSKDYDELDEKFETAEELFKKFISRHEAGLLPDRFIYEEIKQFLDGKE